MKTIWIIYGVLGISLITNIIFFAFDRDDNKGVCENKGRYDKENGVGAICIEDSVAKELVLKYRADYPPENNNNRPTS